MTTELVQTNKTIEKKPKFTERELKFCEAYVTNGFNAKRALIAAGYAPTTIPYVMLNRPKIRDKINELLEPALRAKGISKERLLLDLKSISVGDITDIIEVSDSNIKLKDNLGNMGGLVKRIAYKKDGMIAIDMHDRVRAAEILLRVLGAEAPKQIDVKIGPDAEAFKQWEMTQQRIANNELEQTIIDVEVETEPDNENDSPDKEI